MSAASETELPLPRGGVAPAGNADGRYHTNARPEMLPFVPAAARRILDVGCGAGVFASALKRERPGAEVWGVEPEALAHASAAKVLDHVVHGLFDEALGLPEAHFDAIVFNDSLEHFPDHRPALRLALRLLAPGGTLVASVPNVRYWPHLRHYLFEADWRYENEGIRDHTHLRFFTRRSFERSLHEAGFEVLAAQGINPCWAGLRRRLALALLPAGMQDLLYLQFAMTAREASPARQHDPRSQS